MVYKGDYRNKVIDRFQKTYKRREEGDDAHRY
jgi:hypothetical protein